MTYVTPLAERIRPLERAAFRKLGVNFPNLTIIFT